MMHYRLREFCLAVSVGAFYTLPVLAQQRHEIADSLSCSGCQIVLERVSVLGSPDSDAVIGDPTDVVIDSRGRIFVVFFDAPDQIARFSKDGEFQLHLGRTGEGPGEFGRITDLSAGPADTLLVLDPGRGRVSAISPDGEYAWGFRWVGIPHGLLWEGGENLVFASEVLTEERIGLPLHTVSRDGRILNSFGGTGGGVYRPDMPYLNQRALAGWKDNGFWAGHKTQYQVDLWNAHGEKVVEVVRTAEWFEPYFRKEPLSADQPPSPFLEAISPTSDGRFLITVCTVAAPDWEHHLREVMKRPAERRWDGFWVGDIRHSIVEVLDLSSGTVAARETFPGLILGFAGPEHVYSPTRDEQGNPYIEIWRIRFTETTKGGER